MPFSFRSLGLATSLLLPGLGSKLVQAAILFQGATIISFDTASSQIQVLSNSSLLIENDSIARIFNSSCTDMPANVTETIDATGKIISPGFIDTHHHLWQTAFKTIGSNTTLADYFQKYGEYGPSVTNFTPKDKYLGQLTGIMELLNAGTTTVLDHAHGDSSNETADATLNATLDSGIRAYYAMAIHPLGNNFTIDDQMYKLQTLANDPRLGGRSTVRLGLAYDFFWNAPAAEIQRLRDIVESKNLSVVTTHYLGGPWYLVNSPTQVNQAGMLNTSVPVIFAHAAFVEGQDVELLRLTNQYVSATAESEFHYGHNNARSWLLQDQAALGVDTHFTFSTDMIGQARLWLQNLRRRQYEQVLNDQLEIPLNNPMSVRQAFHLITRAGGLALRRDDIGIISVGAKADLVVFDGDSPNMLGWKDPVAAIVLHSNVGDVSDVMVNGVFVKRNHSLLYSDYGDVKTRFLESKDRIQSIWAGIDWPPLNEGGQLWFNVTPYGATDVIDVQRGDGTGY